MKNLLLFLLSMAPITLTYSQTQKLYTPAATFENEDHIVATTFFHWYATNGGQLSGPWPPLEGRENWTGLPDWWKTQIKQIMMANIDVLYVHLINSAEIRRILFFEAYNELRAEGYDVPKIAPFLDPLITWFNQPKVDLATMAGKDSLVAQYVRFYDQYFEKNPDSLSADYLAKIDDKLILLTWHLFLNFENVDQLNRADLTQRLAAAFPNIPAFQKGFYMITPALNDPTFNFTDERTPMFEITKYFHPNTFKNRKTVQLKAGYWDQNVRTPGDFLPRDGGIHYSDAWDQVDSTFNRVYIESWNEYDEGTGIYAAAPDTLFLINNNPNTDTWSTTDDPYEYIRTTASGAAAFNERPELDALFLYDNFPDTVRQGETYEVQLRVRNEGNLSWTHAKGIELRQVDSDPIKLNYLGGIINDATDEIPIYGGIFRGRPINFELELNIPDTVGNLTTHWQMHKNGQAFGDTLSAELIIEASTASSDYKASPQFTISPNPSDGVIRLDWIGPFAKRIDIYTATGLLWESFENVPPGANIRLPDGRGIFFIQINLNGKMHWEKVIKK